MHFNSSFTSILLYFDSKPDTETQMVCLLSVQVLILMIFPFFTNPTIHHFTPLTSYIIPQPISFKLFPLTNRTKYINHSSFHKADLYSLSYSIFPSSAITYNNIIKLFLKMSPLPHPTKQTIHNYYYLYLPSSQTPSCAMPTIQSVSPLIPRTH